MNARPRSRSTNNRKRRYGGLAAVGALLLAAPAGASAPGPGPGTGGSGAGTGGGAGTELPSNAFTLTGVKAYKDGVLAFRLKAGRAGRFVVVAKTNAARTTRLANTGHANTLKSLLYGVATADAPSAGTSTVNLVPHSAAKRLLRKGKRLLVSATITFTPTGGQPRSLTTSGSVKLKKKSS